MKQVVFAIALLAMASLTGCLNGDDSSVDDKTDDTTSDTTEDNTDTTQDDTDTTDDTKDDELIDPVGGNGDITIPEDSSIFMDSSGGFGEWNCTGDDADRVCNYEYYNVDAFVNNYHNDGTLSSISYRDSDGIENSINFNGWVNKTGNTVTIEGLNYPDRGPAYDSDGNFNYLYSDRFVSSTCNNVNTCQIIFHGHNGLTYNGWFTLSSSTSWSYYDAEGTHYNMYEYSHYTVTFDLPFEPYAFSILNGYDLEQQYRSVDRIF